MTVSPATGALDAGERLRRLLCVLAYLAEVGETTLSDLSTRFGVDRSTIVHELELAACCGLPPYTPDQLLELIIDGERVMAYGLEAVRRPPRLTPDEGFAVAAAARTLLSLSETGQDSPLRRALDKLEIALGNAEISVEIDHPTHFDELRKAAVEGELVEIDYLGAQRGAETTRVVMAYAVVAREGHFYLDAFCYLANDWRRFQLDRIVNVRPSGKRGEPRTPPPELTGTRAFAGGPTTRLVHLAIDGDDSVLVERFAAGPGRQSDDGRTIVPVEIGDEGFLGRLMLRLGPTAEVVDPPELRHAHVEVARRALARYVE